VRVAAGREQQLGAAERALELVGVVLDLLAREPGEREQQALAGPVLEPLQQIAGPGQRAAASSRSETRSYQSDQLPS
jgi:hypothetical protein